MSRTLIWDGDAYRRSQSTITADRSMEHILPLPLFGMGVLLFLAHPGAWPLALAAVVIAVLINNNKQEPDLIQRRELNTSYYESMRQALVTPYPHGIAYILRSILEMLNQFNITALPTQDKFYDVHYGWPNQTILQESADAADYLASKWFTLEPSEKSLAMTTIRNMFKTEVIYLRGRMIVRNRNFPVVEYFGADIALTQQMKCTSLYIYSFGDEDLQTLLGDKGRPTCDQQSAPNPPSKLPTSQSTYDKPTLEEYLQINQSLQYLTKEEQVREYNRHYGVNDEDTVTDVSPPTDTTDQDIW